jgi:hypothetical protein
MPTPKFNEIIRVCLVCEMELEVFEALCTARVRDIQACLNQKQKEQGIMFDRQIAFQKMSAYS